MKIIRLFGWHHYRIGSWVKWRCARASFPPPTLSSPFPNLAAATTPLVAAALFNCHYGRGPLRGTGGPNSRPSLPARARRHSMGPWRTLLMRLAAAPRRSLRRSVCTWGVHQLLGLRCAGARVEPPDSLVLFEDWPASRDLATNCGRYFYSRWGSMSGITASWVALSRSTNASSNASRLRTRS